MDQKSNEEILNDIAEEAKTNWESFSTNIDSPETAIRALVKVVKNQQQQIELLQDQLRYHVEQVHKDEL